MSQTNICKDKDGTTGVTLANNMTSGDITVGNGTMTGKINLTAANYIQNAQWTCNLTDSAGNTFTQTSQYGYYTRFGNLCFISCKITYTGKGSAVAGNTVRITGLPFTGSDRTGIEQSLPTSDTNCFNLTQQHYVHGHINRDENFIHFTGTNAASAGITEVLVSHMTTSGKIGVSGVYMVKET